MKKLFQNLATIFILLFLFSSCSKTESSSSSSSSSSSTTKTKMTVFLNSVNGAVKDMNVYAYNQQTFATYGENTSKANEKAISDASGNAVFNDIEYAGTFDNLTTNNFTFTAYYNLNGVNKKKSATKTVTKGSQYTITIILD